MRTLKCRVYNATYDQVVKVTYYIDRSL